MKNNKGKFCGKVLLELGTNVGSLEIIRYAQSEGAHVIVIDYNAVEDSPAKQIADENATISTQDIEAVYNFAKSKKIDGIFCGASDINLNTVLEVSSRLKLPCYFNKQHQRIHRDKLYFKHLINTYGINVPKEIIINNESELKSVKFPVIAKPIDQSGGIGVRICRNITDLKEAIEYAKQKSFSGNILIEEYVEGDEVTVLYTIRDGIAKLTCMQDNILSTDHEDIISQADIKIAPSKHINLFCQKFDSKVKKFMENELYSDGVAFIQGIIKDGDFYPFEINCRISGVMSFYFTNKEYGFDYLQMLVDYSLLGNSNDHDISRINPYYKGVGCRFSIFTHAGEIGTLQGLEKIKKLPDVIDARFTRDIGYSVINDGTLLQTIMNCHIYSDSIDGMIDTIKKIQKEIIVLDESGNNMLYKPFDVNKLL